MEQKLIRKIKENIRLHLCQKGDRISLGRYPMRGASRYMSGSIIIEKIKPIKNGMVQLKYQSQYGDQNKIHKIDLGGESTVERTRDWVESDGENAGYYEPTFITLDGIRYRIAHPKEMEDLPARHERNLKARALYAAGDVTTHDISGELKVSNERVAAWCDDLIEERYNGRKKRTAEKKAERRGGPQVLSDEQVLEIRRRVREVGIKHWVKLGKEYRVAASTVAYAAKGITFRHLDAQVAPITNADARSAPKGRAPTKPKRNWKSDLPDELIAEIVELRRSDPVKWTYGECGRLLFERTGRKYCAGPVAVLILRRHPEMKELEKIYVPPKQRDPATRKKYKPLTQAEKKEKAARMRAWRLAKMTQREQDAELQRWLDAEDAYEAEQMKKAA